MEQTIDIRDANGRPMKSPQELAEGVRGADWRPTMDEIIKVLEDDHRERFAADVSPDGQPWPELAPYTIEKKGHDRKLEEFGFLLESETDSNSPFAIREINDQGDEKTIKFGTRRPWAGAHQHGTEKIPQRKHLGASQRAKDKIRDVINARVRAIVTGGN